MKILITGGAGFIGSNLTRYLVKEKGCEVVNLDKLTYAGNPDSLADLADHPRYHFEFCDLANPEAPGTLSSSSATPEKEFRAQRQDQTHRGSDHSSSAPSHHAQKSLYGIFAHHQPDAVMHLAAESHVDRSIDDPSEFIQSNIVGTYHLLQASLAYWRSLPEAGECEGGKVGKYEGGDQFDLSSFQPSYLRTKRSFRFLHVSTDEVYGSLALDAPGFSETTPYDPRSPYSASKASADHLVRAWHHTYGLPTLVTHSSNTYGPHQFPEKLIPMVILKCLSGEPIPVYGRGENIRDWLYVEDHCEALHAVLNKGRVGEHYNIGGNNERQNIELVRRLCQLMDDEVRQNVDGQHGSAGPEGMTARGALLRAAREQLHAPSHLPTFPPSDPVSYESLITFVTDRPGHDYRYALNTTKIKEELGWQPKTDLEQGLRLTVQWWRTNNGSPLNR